MTRAGDRMAGGLDDAFDVVAGEQGGDIVGDEGRAALDRLAGALGGVALCRPTDALQRFARLGDVEIGDGHHVVAGDPLRLGKHHGAEFAGADQTDPHRATSFGTGGKQSIEVHSGVLRTMKSVVPTAHGATRRSPTAPPRRIFFEGKDTGERVSFRDCLCDLLRAAGPPRQTHRMRRAGRLLLR